MGSVKTLEKPQSCKVLKLFYSGSCLSSILVDFIMLATSDYVNQKN